MDPFGLPLFFFYGCFGTYYFYYYDFWVVKLLDKDKKEKGRIKLEAIPNPTDSFKKYTFEEMKSALEKWLSPGDEAEEGDIISEANDSFEDEVPTSNDLPWEKESAAPKANYSLNTTKVKQSKGDQFNALFEDED